LGINRQVLDTGDIADGIHSRFQQIPP
jgi:hypothetical protein